MREGGPDGGQDGVDGEQQAHQDEGRVGEQLSGAQRGCVVKQEQAQEEKGGEEGGATGEEGGSKGGRGMGTGKQQAQLSDVHAHGHKADR